MKKVEVNELDLKRMLYYIKSVEEGKTDLELIKSFKEKFGDISVNEWMELLTQS